MYLIIDYFMIYSPLEQFIIFSFFQWSNVSFTMLLILFFFYLLSKFNFLLSSHIEWWYDNIKIIPSHLFIILTIWFFILFSNLLGMVPYTSTLTAQFILVLSITIPLFIGINILGISLHGINIFYLILPTGVPFILIPYIVFLEFFAYFVRVLSLTLRLSANIIAGHILIKIMLTAFLSLPYLSFLLIPFVVLELLVAFLQSYVFITLVLSYYQDVFLPH